LRHLASCCAISALLAQFFTLLETAEIAKNAFIFKGSMIFQPTGTVIAWKEGK
jgi:hypothetical protein